MKKGAKESVTWTGKNLAEMKRLHKDVAHYPEEEGEAFQRDASQHPDNLHLEVDGRTLIAGIGDTISRDEQGQLSVEKGDQEPRTLTPKASTKGRAVKADASDSIRSKGGTR